MAYWLTVSALICTCLCVCTNAFVLDGIPLRPLPQMAKYGRSMVLVGGNLQDNNSDIYNTIVEMAVTNILYMFGSFNKRAGLDHKNTGFKSFYGSYKDCLDQTRIPFL